MTDKEMFPENRLSHATNMRARAALLDEYNKEKKKEEARKSFIFRFAKLKLFF